MKNILESHNHTSSPTQHIQSPTNKKSELETLRLQEEEKVKSDLLKIAEIQANIDSSVRIEDNTFPEEIHIVNGEEVTVRFVSKEHLGSAFGCCYGDGLIEVRDDLPPRVREFVKAHELYHQGDMSDFGGWIGRELRANFIPGLKDPAGLLATIWATVSSRERIALYIDRIKKGY